jgi:hypothetical protein
MAADKTLQLWSSSLQEHALLHSEASLDNLQAKQRRLQQMRAQERANAMAKAQLYETSLQDSVRRAQLASQRQIVHDTEMGLAKLDAQVGKALCAAW